jgi:hypothetical protein
MTTKKTKQTTLKKLLQHLSLIETLTGNDQFVEDTRINEDRQERKHLKKLVEETLAYDKLIDEISDASNSSLLTDSEKIKKIEDLLKQFNMDSSAQET